MHDTLPRDSAAAVTPPTDQHHFWLDKHVIVTGGAGFLGSVIVQKLHERSVREGDRAQARASDQGRRLGFRTALNAAGIPVDERLIVELERHHVQPWPDYELGYEQSAQLLHRGVYIDAILAYSDAIAIGALRAIRDRTALTVPEDLSMIGFDGLAIGKFMVPRLTSIGIPWYRVALAAGATLRARTDRRRIGDHQHNCARISQRRLKLVARELRRWIDVCSQIATRRSVSRTGAEARLEFRRPVHQAWSTRPARSPSPPRERRRSSWRRARAQGQRR
jgi:hypothetical protein